MAQRNALWVEFAPFNYSSSPPPALYIQFHNKKFPWHMCFFFCLFQFCLLAQSSSYQIYV